MTVSVEVPSKLMPDDEGVLAIVEVEMFPTALIQGNVAAALIRGEISSAFTKSDPVVAPSE